MRIVVVGDFDEIPDRLDGTLKIMRELAKLAARKG
jgi:transcription-repair coupling factor (superfamily II helicase)